MRQEPNMQTCDTCGHEYHILSINNGGECDECAHTGKLQCSKCGEWFEITCEFEGDIYCKECADKFDLSECTSCNKWLESGDLYEYGSDLYCRDCADSANLMTCDYCGKLHDSDEMAECGGDWYCVDCANHKGYYLCDGCGGWSRDTSEAWGRVYCPDCFCDRFSICDGCGNVIDNDDAICTDNGVFCENCHQEGNYEPQNFRGCDEYDKVGSPRKFGIEIETYCCDNSHDLPHTTRYWGEKDDGSINGSEFYSSVLHGNDGFKAIDDICRFAERNRWSTDECCGLHIHLDMRDEPLAGLQAIACAYHLTWETWKSCVDSSRYDNSWCRAIRAELADYIAITDLTDWSRFAGKHTRYIWVNWEAYCKFRSLEIRLHQGCLDATRVKNWITAHTVFCDWASKTGWDGVKNSLWGVSMDEQKDVFSDIFKNAGCPHINKFYNWEKVYV